MAEIKPISTTSFQTDAVMTWPPVNGSVCARGASSSEQIATEVATQCIIIIVMFALGCTTDVMAMWNCMKQPKQMFAFLALQQLFNPWFGLALTQLFQITKPHAMGVIIIAICPGGAYSNVACYWLDGDVNLSIVLTCLSTLLSIGTMPLWLHVFPTVIGITDECLKIPFKELGLTLVAIMVPVIAGLAAKYKFPKASRVLTKVCTVLATLAIVAFSIIFLTKLTSGVLDDVHWTIVVLACLFQLVGFTLGYFVTRIPSFKFTIAARRTVAVEIMLQNSGLALAITATSYDFSNPLLPKILQYIIIYSMFQTACLFGGGFSYLIIKWKRWCTCLLIIEDEKRKEKEKQTTDALLELG